MTSNIAIQVIVSQVITSTCVCHPISNHMKYEHENRSSSKYITWIYVKLFTSLCSKRELLIITVNLNFNFNFRNDKFHVIKLLFPFISNQIYKCIVIQSGAWVKYLNGLVVLSKCLHSNIYNLHYDTVCQMCSNFNE